MICATANPEFAMGAHDHLLAKLQSSRAAWPSAKAWPNTQALKQRLAKLPDQIAGLSLQVLKDTTLPDWKDGGAEQLRDRLSAAGPADGDLQKAIEELPLPDESSPESDDRLAWALEAARVLRKLGSHDRAVQLLWSVARAVMRRPQLTILALWLLEVADHWLAKATCQHLRCRVRADLGEALIRVGSARQGCDLLRGASDDLFQVVGQDTDSDAVATQAWQYRYQAVEGRLRAFATKVEREQAVIDLRSITERRAAIPRSEPWFHAGMELIAAEASPDRAPATVVKIEQLLQQTQQASLSAEARHRIDAHAHQSMGMALSYGSNRFLHTRARDELDEAARLFKEASDWYHLAQALDQLARIRMQLGEHEHVDAIIKESWNLKQALKDMLGLGACLNSRAESLLRRGLPREACPLYDANIILIEQIPDVRPKLIVQNLGQKATALMASYQDPFLTGPPTAEQQADLAATADVLKEYARRMAGQPNMEVSAGYLLMLQSGLKRLEARGLSDPKARRQRLVEGETLATQSILEFKNTKYTVALVNVELQLAGIRTDLALVAGDEVRKEELLSKAHQALKEAEKHIWDSYERAYLELEWAWYHEAQRDKAMAKNHMASARHHANACGNESIQVRAEAVMGVRLRGPTGHDRWEVVLPPGEQIDIPVNALDWRDRPLAGYTLEASVHAPVSVVGGEACTNAVGRAFFTVAAPAGTSPVKAIMEIRDHNVLREARVTIHVQPLPIELDPDEPTLAGLQLGVEDRVVLRNLFGPRFRHILIRKRFTSGLGGAQVLLIEPRLALPEDLGQPPGQDEDGLRAQRCLVKLGERRAIADEIAGYERHVRDLLSPNVSRIAESTVWGGRAGIRMSLAGDQDWDRAVQEMDWLIRAPTVEAHHLLVDMFGRDLGMWWYNNGSEPRMQMRLFQVYGRQFPPLLTLREPGPADGLLLEKPPNMITTQLADGLLPPGDGKRGLERGHTVYVGEMQIADWRRLDHRGEWEYRLADESGLRVAFRSQLPPQYLEPNGMEDNVVGLRRHVVGIIEYLLFDRLAETLQDCTLAFPRGAAEDVALSDDGARLHVRAGKQEKELKNPLLKLHDFLRVELPHKRSIIHGDLHARNVIVSPRGMPYYIDFSEAGIGPTLFDFVKHETALWDWNLADPPAGTRPCSLSAAVGLMEELAQNRFPGPFVPPRSLPRKETEETLWLGKFYHYVGTLRALARQHSAAPDKAPDYFTPLCVYAALCLRWCNPAHARDAAEKAAHGRRGVFLTTLAGLLLSPE
jgi:hypothetical protein